MGEDKKTKILSSINQNLEENKKHFGTRQVEMPSGNTKKNEDEEELLDDQLGFFDVIYKALGAILMGKKAKAFTDGKKLSAAIASIQGDGLLIDVNEIRKFITAENKIKMSDRAKIYDTLGKHLGDKTDNIFTKIEKYIKNVSKKIAGDKTFEELFDKLEDKLKNEKNETRNSEDSKNVAVSGNIKIDGLNSDTIDKLSELLKTIANDLDIDKLGKIFDKLESFGDKIEEFSIACKSVDWKSIAKLSNFVKELRNLVLCATASLIIAGLAMKIVSAKDMFKFNGLLIILISGLFMSAKMFMPKNADMFKYIAEFGKFVALVAGTLLFAGLVVKMIKMKDLINFSLLLVGFIFVLSPAIGIIGRFLGDSTILDEMFGTIGGVNLLKNRRKKSKSRAKAFETIYEFAKFIALVGGTLLFAGVVSRLVSMDHLLSFSGLLIGFIFALTPVIILIGNFLGDEEETEEENIWTAIAGKLKPNRKIKSKKKSRGSAFASIAEFGKFIMMLAATLLLGSIVYGFIDHRNLIKFATMLIGFTILLMVGIGIASRIAGPKGLAVGEGLGKLVKALAISLIIGGVLFTFFPELVKGVMLFGTILSVFVFFICTGLGKLQEMKVGKLFGLTITLLLLTSGIAAVLLFAGKIMTDNPMVMLGTLVFIGLAALAFTGLYFLIKALAKFDKKDIGRALLATMAMLALCLVVGGMMYFLAKMAEQVINEGTGVLIFAGILMMLVVLGGLTFVIHKLSDPKFIKNLPLAAFSILAMCALVIIMGALMWGLAEIAIELKQKDALVEAIFVIGGFLLILWSLYGVIALLTGQGVLSTLTGIPGFNILKGLKAVFDMPLIASAIAKIIMMAGIGVAMTLVMGGLALVAGYIKDKNALDSFLFVLVGFEIILWSLWGIIALLTGQGVLSTLTGIPGFNALSGLKAVFDMPLIASAIAKIVMMAGLAVAMTGVIIGLAYAARLLKGNEEQFLYTLIAFEAITISMGIIVLILTKKTFNPIAMVNATLAMIGIGILAASMSITILNLIKAAILLKEASIIDLILVVGGMVLLTFSFVLLIEVLDKITTGPGVLKAELALLGIVAIIGLMTLVMNYIANIAVKIEKAGGKMALITVVGSMLALVTVLSILVVALSLIPISNIIIGEIALTGIVGISYLLGLVADVWADVSLKLIQGGGADMFISAIVTMGLLISGLTVICAIIGIPIVAGFVALGAVVMLAMVGVVMALGLVMMYMINVVNYATKVKPGGIKKLIEVASLIPDILWELKSLVLYAPFTPAIMLALTITAISLHILMGIVAALGTLQINEYNKNGDVIGKRQITQGDFAKAAENVMALLGVFAEPMKKFSQDKEYMDLIGTNTLFSLSPMTKIINRNMDLAKLLSKLSITVANLGNLKVPTGWKPDGEGGAITTGYRKLEKSDFKNAAENVTEILMTFYKPMKTLGNDAEYINTIGVGNIFGTSPWSKIVDRNIKLAKLLTKLASAVSDIANLKIATEWKQGENGPEATSWRAMNREDFRSAANNTKLLLTTFANVFKNLNSDTDYTDVIGTNYLGIFDSPSQRIINRNLDIAKLMTKLANAVSDVANLKIATGWKIGENGPEATGYRSMNKEDFKSAGKNTEKLLTIFTDIFRDLGNDTNYMNIIGTNGFNIWGDDNQSIAQRIINRNLDIAKLMGKLALTVSDISNLKIATGWKAGQNGPEATGYETMNRKHFKDATNNAVLILTTFADAFKELIYDKKYMDDVIGTNTLFSKSPISKVINRNKEIAKLVSELATTIKDISELKIATKYDKDGKAIEYRNLKQEDFEEAGKSIVQIITTIGEGLITTYDKRPELFDYDKDNGTTKFGLIVKSVTGISELIGNIASGIKMYADLKIPTEWDKKTGEPIGYVTITDKIFEDAGEHISTVVLSLAGIVANIANDPLYNRFFGDNGDAELFRTITESIGSVSELVGNIAQGLLNYSELKFPTKWDAQGNPIDFAELNTDTFKAVTENVDLVISNLITSIESAYNGREPLFKSMSETGKIKGYLYGNYVSEEEAMVNPFVIVAKSMITAGTMLSAISEAIRDYALLQVPEYGPDGRPTGNMIKLEEKHFTDAADHIKKIITTLGGAIIGVYNSDAGKEIFEPLSSGGVIGFLFGNTVTAEEAEVNPFTTVVKSMMGVGAMLTKISKAVKEYALLQVPEYGSDGIPTGNMIKLEENHFTDAANHIKKIITTIGGAIIDIYNKKPYIFHVNSNGNSTFKNVVESVSILGKIISDISQGIMIYASGAYVKEWEIDEKTGALKPGTGSNAIGKIGQPEFDEAGKAISSILTHIGGTIIGVIKAGHLKRVQAPDIASLFTAISNIGNTISNIAKGVMLYATGTMPKFDEKTGKISKDLIHIDDSMYTKAAETISQVIFTVANKVIEIASDPIFKTWRPVVKNIVALYTGIADPLYQIVETVVLMASGQYKRNPNDPNEKPIQLKHEDIEKAITHIGETLTAVGNGIVSVVKNNEEMFGKILDTTTNSYTFEELKDLPIYKATQIIQKITDPIGKISEFLLAYSGGDYWEYVYDANGNLLGEKKISLSQQELEAAKTNIKSMIGALISPFYEIWKGEGIMGKYHEMFYGKSDGNWITSSVDELLSNKMNESIKSYSKIIEGIGETLQILAENSKEISNDQLKTNLNNAFDLYIGLIYKLWGDGDESKQKTIENVYVKASTVKEGIHIYGEIFSNIFDSLNNISNLYANIKLTDPSPIKRYTEDIVNFILNIAVTKNIINNISVSIENLSTSIGKLNTMMDSKVLKDSQISNFIDKINNTKGLDGFKKFNVEFNKYIKAINQVDIKKLNSLYNLAWTCNELSKRLGSLDKFTKTLANEIAKVLTELTKQLSIATKAIDKTEKLQKDRHTKIEESAKKIKELLDKEMKVQIVAPEPSETTADSIDSSTGGSMPAGTSDTSNGGSISTVSSTSSSGGSSSSTSGGGNSSPAGVSLQQIEQALTNILKKAKLLK